MSVNDLNTFGLTYYPHFADTMADDVLRFAVSFDQLPVRCGEPIPANIIELATKLIHEEMVKEFTPAYNAFCAHQSLENMTAMVDGALDTIYVILWMLQMFGVPVNACWKEIQRSNMAKLLPDGSYLKNPETGKVMKPEGWTPPDLFKILMEASSAVEYRNGIAQHESSKR